MLVHNCLQLKSYSVPEKGSNNNEEVVLLILFFFKQRKNVCKVYVRITFTRASIYANKYHFKRIFLRKLLEKDVVNISPRQGIPSRILCSLEKYKLHTFITQ